MVDYGRWLLEDGNANDNMNMLKIEAACITALLIVAAVGVASALRNRRQIVPPPEVPVAQTPAEVRVKTVERNPVAAVVTVAPDASRAVAIICGKGPATSNRYEVRNGALRSIARRRDLPEK